MKKLTPFIAIVAACLVASSFYILFDQLDPGNTYAPDWKLAFQPAGVGETTNMVTPYWAAFLAFIPAQFDGVLGYFLWILLGMLGMYWATRKTRFLKWWMPFISFPLAHGVLTGQIDLFIFLGVGLALHAVHKSEAFLGGLAIMLLLVKPQIGLMVAAITAYHFIKYSGGWKKNLLDLIVAPAFFFSLSLWVFPLWPLEWWEKISSGFVLRPENVRTNIALFQLSPFASVGLLALAFPFIVKITNWNSRFLVALIAPMLVFPYVPFYSTAGIFMFALPLTPWLIGAQWIFAFVTSLGVSWQWLWFVLLGYAAYTLMKPKHKVLNIIYSGDFIDKDYLKGRGALAENEFRKLYENEWTEPVEIPYTGDRHIGRRRRRGVVKHTIERAGTIPPHWAGDYYLTRDEGEDAE